MDSLCRLCMNVCSVGMEPIFRSVMARCLATKIIGITQLTLYEGDGLPANVCQQCIFKLDMSDSFIQKCILSDKAFRAMQVVQNAVRAAPRNEEKLDSQQLVEYRSLDETMSVAHQPKNVLRYARLNKELPKGGNDNNLRIKVIQTIKIEDSDQSNSSAADGADISTTSKHSNQNLDNQNVNNGLLGKIDHGSKNDSVPRNDGVCNVGESGLVNTEIAKVVVAAKHKCNVCQKELVTKAGLKSHSKRHKIEKSRLLAMETRARKLLEKDVQTNSTAKNNDIGASAKHPCEICDRTFDTASGLANHSLGHSGKRRMFACDYCHREFVQISHLNRHKQKRVCKRKHIRKKKRASRQRTTSFECDVCRKTFRMKKTLTEHILMHFVERPFNCAECDMCFATPGTLHNHKLVHSTDRPHKCELCEKKFKRKDHLGKHMQRHAASKKKSSKDSNILTVQSCVSAVYGETSNVSLNLESSKPNHKIVSENLFSFREGVDEDMGETLLSCEDTVIYLDEGADPESLPESFKVHIEDNLSSNIDPLSNDVVIESVLESHEDMRGRSFSCTDSVKSFDESLGLMMAESVQDSKDHIRENLFSSKDPSSNNTDLESVLEFHEVLRNDSLPCKDSLEPVGKVSDLESLIPSNVVACGNGFPCNVCGRRFTSRPSVEQHMIVHFRAARHKCSKCARCFQTSLGLKDHMKFHEEGHQFMCSICCITFDGEDSLQAHLLNHTNEFNVAKS